MNWVWFWVLFDGSFLREWLVSVRKPDFGTSNPF